MQCPCCQNEIEEVPAAFLAHGSFTRLERRIINALARQYPLALSRERIIGSMYFDDPNGGPEDAGRVFRVVMCRLRKKLVSLGWNVPHLRGGFGSTGFYRLEKDTISERGRQPENPEKEQ